MNVEHKVIGEVVKKEIIYEHVYKPVLKTTLSDCFWAAGSSINAKKIGEGHYFVDEVVVYKLIQNQMLVVINSLAKGIMARRFADLKGKSSFFPYNEIYKLAKNRKLQKDDVVILINDPYKIRYSVSNLFKQKHTDFAEIVNFVNSEYAGVHLTEDLVKVLL